MIVDAGGCPSRRPTGKAGPRRAGHRAGSWRAKVSLTTTGPPGRRIGRRERAALDQPQPQRFREAWRDDVGAGRATTFSRARTGRRQRRTMTRCVVSPNGAMLPAPAATDAGQARATRRSTASTNAARRAPARSLGGAGDVDARRQHVRRRRSRHRRCRRRSTLRARSERAHRRAPAPARLRTISRPERRRALVRRPSGRRRPSWSAETGRGCRATPAGGRRCRTATLPRHRCRRSRGRSRATPRGGGSPAGASDRQRVHHEAREDQSGAEARGGEQAAARSGSGAAAAPRLAPRAARTASSRRRATPLGSSRLATLAQPTSSTSTTPTVKRDQRRLHGGRWRRRAPTRRCTSTGPPLPKSRSAMNGRLTPRAAAVAFARRPARA